MIRVEILCDQMNEPGARDPKHRCACLSNDTPCGEAENIDTAHAKARRAAEAAGWTRKATSRRTRIGWICAPCARRLAQ